MEPALHNIPINSDVGRQIRRGFFPRHNEVLVSIDYSGLEMKMAAEMKKR